MNTVLREVTREDMSQFIQCHDFFVVDKRVYDLHSSVLRDLTDKKVYWIDDPEGSKNTQVFDEICDFFLDSGINRRSELVAIGGGATSDLAGLVAATLLRGLKLSIIPTTILGTIDAAIGGKTAINTKHGKNLIGAFHEASEVLFYPPFLATLSKQEKDSGNGELLKYFFLSREIYKSFEEGTNAYMACARYKQKICELDFKDQGSRQLLNLGHTIGHGLEKLNSLPHGIAVSLGIKLIIDMFSPQLADDYLRYAKILTLDDYDVDKVNFEKLWEYISHDKKIVGESIKLIVPKEIGKVEIEKISLAKLKQMLKQNEWIKSRAR